MLFNIRMGWSDIWKHKLFLIGILFLVLFHTVLAMTAFTYINDHGLLTPQEEEHLFPAGNLVNTRYDYVYQAADIEEFSGIVRENAVTLRPSHSLSDLTGRTVQLVLGDARLIHPSMPNQTGIHAYAFDLKLQESLQVEDEAYPLIKLPFEAAAGFPYDTIFLVYQGRELSEVLHRLVKNNPNLFFEVLVNLRVPRNDAQKPLQIEAFIREKIEGADIKGSLVSDPLTGVGDFFTHFLVPLLCILLIFGILSFQVLFQGNLQRMRRDLSIHIQSGATFQDVLARFCVFYGSILAISFFILSMLGMVVDLLRPFVLTSYAVISLGCLLYIGKVLQQSNLLENMRGDIV